MFVAHACACSIFNSGQPEGASRVQGALQREVTFQFKLRPAQVPERSFDDEFRPFEYRKLAVESLRRTGHL